MFLPPCAPPTDGKRTRCTRVYKHFILSRIFLSFLRSFSFFFLHFSVFCLQARARRGIYSAGGSFIPKIGGQWRVKLRENTRTAWLQPSTLRLFTMKGARTDLTCWCLFPGVPRTIRATFLRRYSRNRNPLINFLGFWTSFLRYSLSLARVNPYVSRSREL